MTKKPINTFKHVHIRDGLSVPEEVPKEDFFERGTIQSFYVGITIYAYSKGERSFKEASAMTCRTYKTSKSSCQVMYICSTFNRNINMEDFWRVECCGKVPLACVQCQRNQFISASAKYSRIS